MRPAALLPLALALLALTGGTGCASAELARVRDDVARTQPGLHVGAGTNLSFGAVLLGAVRPFVADEVSVEGLDLRDVRRVQVAVYPVEGTVDARATAMPPRLRRLVARGWEPVVVSREDGELTWILARTRGTEVTDLFIASLGDEELSLVRVGGRLSGALAGLLREHVVDVEIEEEPEPQAALTTKCD